jgi:hypothetical protein
LRQDKDKKMAGNKKIELHYQNPPTLLKGGYGKVEI